MTIFKRLIYITTLNCSETARLLSDDSERSLTIVERLALRGHLLVCRECRRYRRYLRTLGAAMRGEDADAATLEEIAVDESLPDDARARIRERLSEI